MFKYKIYNYFTREIIKTFVIVLLTFSMIAWTVRAVNFLDLIIEDGYDLTTYFYYSMFNLTSIIPRFIPLSFLIALVVSINNFEKRNELIVLWSTGLNKIDITNLFLKIAIIITILQFCISTFITPTTLNISRSLLSDKKLDLLSLIIKTNDFGDAFKGITIYVEKKDSNNNLENVFIKDDLNIFGNLNDDEPSANQNKIITAKSGYVEGSKIILSNGIIQTFSNDKVKNVYFQKTMFSLDKLSNRVIKIPKIQETSTVFLLKCMAVIDLCKYQNKMRDVYQELSRRIITPFYIPLIAIICSFILITRKKKYNDRKLYIYFGLSFCCLVFAELMLRFAGLSIINTIIYSLFPVLLIIILKFYLSKNFNSKTINI